MIHTRWISAEISRNVDYIDGHNDGPYAWLIDLTLLRLQLIIGHRRKFGT